MMTQADVEHYLAEHPARLPRNAAASGPWLGHGSRLGMCAREWPACRLLSWLSGPCGPRRRTHQEAVACASIKDDEGCSSCACLT